MILEITLLPYDQNYYTIVVSFQLKLQQKYSKKVDYNILFFKVKIQFTSTEVTKMEKISDIMSYN